MQRPHLPAEPLQGEDDSGIADVAIDHMRLHQRMAPIGRPPDFQCSAESSVNSRRAVPWSISTHARRALASSSEPSLCSARRPMSIASISRGLARADRLVIALADQEIVFDARFRNGESGSSTARAASARCRGYRGPAGSPRCARCRWNGPVAGETGAKWLSSSRS